MGFQGVVVARRVVSVPAINQIGQARDRRGVVGDLAVGGTWWWCCSAGTGVAAGADDDDGASDAVSLIDRRRATSRPRAARAAPRGRRSAPRASRWARGGLEGRDLRLLVREARHELAEELLEARQVQDALQGRGGGGGHGCSRRRRRQARWSAFVSRLLPASWTSNRAL